MMSPNSVGRRAQDSLLAMIRVRWDLLVACIAIGAAGGGVISARITAPAQVIELRARVDTVKSDVRDIQRDLDVHVRGMNANRDTVLTLLNLLILDRCFASGDRMFKRQLHCPDR